MNQVGIIANLEKQGVADVLPGLDALAQHYGVQLHADPALADMIPSLPTLPCQDFGSKLDAVLTLGGDGTLLTAVRELGSNLLPFIGVNFGKLGFLTSLTANELETAFVLLGNGEAVRSTRPMIRCRVEKANGDTHISHALNDVVLSWGTSSHIGHLQVSVQNAPVTTFTCDGLILATPTGSTGHSLSAGGPILHPDTDSLVLSPICPHSMTVRPVVIPGLATVDISPCEHSKTLVLATDGQPVCEVGPGDRIATMPSERTVTLLLPPGYNYWKMLETKLHWRGSAVLGQS